MSDEITVSVRFAVSNGNYTPGNISLNNLKFDQANAGVDERIQEIGTTEETLANALTTVGWILLRNLDATNYVQWGFATGAYGGRMEPGETAGPFRVEPGTTLYLKANAAACDVWFRWLED